MKQSTLHFCLFFTFSGCAKIENGESEDGYKESGKTFVLDNEPLSEEELAIKLEDLAGLNQLNKFIPEIYKNLKEHLQRRVKDGGFLIDRYSNSYPEKQSWIEEKKSEYEEYKRSQLKIHQENAARSVSDQPFQDFEPLPLVNVDNVLERWNPEGYVYRNIETKNASDGCEHDDQEYLDWKKAPNWEYIYDALYGKKPENVVADDVIKIIIALGGFREEISIDQGEYKKIIVFITSGVDSVLSKKFFLFCRAGNFFPIFISNAENNESYSARKNYREYWVSHSLSERPTKYGAIIEAPHERLLANVERAKRRYEYDKENAAKSIGGRVSKMIEFLKRTPYSIDLLYEYLVEENVKISFAGELNEIPKLKLEKSNRVRYIPIAFGFNFGSAVCEKIEGGNEMSSRKLDLRLDSSQFQDVLNAARDTRGVPEYETETVWVLNQETGRIENILSIDQRAAHRMLWGWFQKVRDSNVTPTEHPTELLSIVGTVEKCHNQ